MPKETTKVITLRVPESLRVAANAYVGSDEHLVSLNNVLTDYLIALTGWEPGLTPSPDSSASPAEPPAVVDTTAVTPPYRGPATSRTPSPSNGRLRAAAAADPTHQAAGNASDWISQSTDTYQGWAMRQIPGTRWDVKARQHELRGQTVVQIDEYLSAAGFVGEFKVRPCGR